MLLNLKEIIRNIKQRLEVQLQQGQCSLALVFGHNFHSQVHGESKSKIMKALIVTALIVLQKINSGVNAISIQCQNLINFSYDIVEVLGLISVQSEQTKRFEVNIC